MKPAYLLLKTAAGRGKICGKQGKPRSGTMPGRFLFYQNKNCPKRKVPRQLAST
jgi:hypothetical protein